jgi:uncharacterized membrane protein YfcA
VLFFAIAGAFAQLIDGTLGMAFGITSSTLLVLLGTTPVSASAAVHFAELGTTLASGLSHWRARNVDLRVWLRIGVAGGIGALAGATVLSTVSLASARTWMSALLLTFGAVLLLRFGLGVSIFKTAATSPRSRLLVPLGLVAGFIDASGGGGWGPVTTPTLLALTSSEPRRVVGTVNAAEFLVAVAASLGFIFQTAGNIDWRVVGGLLIGGVLMAPLAARLAGRLPHQPLGALVGGIVLVSNGSIVMRTFQVSALMHAGVLLAILLGTFALAGVAWRRERNQQLA